MAQQMDLDGRRAQAPAEVQPYGSSTEHQKKYHPHQELQPQQRQQLFYGAHLIARAGLLLGLPQQTICGGCAILHHFYAHRSLSRYDVRKTSAASLFLACKYEETLVHASDLHFVYQKLLQRDCSGPSASASGKGPSVSAKEAGKETGKIEGFELRELFLYERTVLDKLGFHLGFLRHSPHRFLLPYVHSLFGADGDASEGVTKGQRTRKGAAEITEKAWGYLNDCYRDQALVCMMLDKSRPREGHDILLDDAAAASKLAVAAIWLSCRVVGRKMPEDWVLAYDCTQGEIEQIAKRMLELYQH